MEKIWLKSYTPGVRATIDFADIPLHLALTQTASRTPCQAGEPEGCRKNSKSTREGRVGKS